MRLIHALILASATSVLANDARAIRVGTVVNGARDLDERGLPRIGVVVGREHEERELEEREEDCDDEAAPSGVTYPSTAASAVVASPSATTVASAAVASPAPVYPTTVASAAVASSKETSTSTVYVTESICPTDSTTTLTSSGTVTLTSYGSNATAVLPTSTSTATVVITTNSLPPSTSAAGVVAPTPSSAALPTTEWSTVSSTSAVYYTASATDAAPAVFTGAANARAGVGSGVVAGLLLALAL